MCLRTRGSLSSRGNEGLGTRNERPKCAKSGTKRVTNGSKRATSGSVHTAVPFVVKSKGALGDVGDAETRFPGVALLMQRSSQSVRSGGHERGRARREGEYEEGSYRC